jgi:iron complex transport system substrate-binding protein
VLRSLEGLSDALGEKERGLRLAARLRAVLEEIARRVSVSPPPRVLYVVWGEPLVVPGRPAFLTDALGRAGGLSVTREAPAAWPTFDLESAIARAPEVILTTPRNQAMLRRIASDPAWAAVPAVRDGRLHTVSESIEQPGPGVVEGIEEAARLLHPEAFGARGPGEAAAKK